jgi:hypothetical protein
MVFVGREHHLIIGALFAAVLLFLPPHLMLLCLNFDDHDDEKQNHKTEKRPPHSAGIGDIFLARMPRYCRFRFRDNSKRRRRGAIVASAGAAASEKSLWLPNISNNGAPQEVRGENKSKDVKTSRSIISVECNITTSIG